MGEKAKKKPGADDTEALRLRIAELERMEDLLRRQLVELQKSEEDYVKGEEKLRNRVDELEQAEAEYRKTVDKLLALVLAYGTSNWVGPAQGPHGRVWPDRLVGYGGPTARWPTASARVIHRCLLETAARRPRPCCPAPG